MTPQAKYILGSFAVIPVLPLMYWQGKRIRSRIPSLPEAKGPSGFSDIGASKQLNLITIGESTIAGIGVDRHEHGFTGTLAVELSKKLKTNVNWKVYAKSGYTAKKIYDKTLNHIDAIPDLIVIGLGGNDAFTLNSPKSWGKQIMNIISKLNALFPEIPIVFSNTPPIKEFPAFAPLVKSVVGNLAELHGKVLKNISDRYQHVHFNDEIITFEKWIHKIENGGKVEDFFSDGVHPSTLTYQVWAKDMAEFILRRVYDYNGSRLD
ncbi:MAG: SGNH/GDSL hydrolase family protein [Flavobacteriales bacterium]|nr:SGNH/GDSL hydrolase family protein [Flavobacteriales bacterium]